MAVLAHVEIEPVRVVQPLRRAAAAGGMERDQVPPPVALLEARGHGVEYRALGVVVDGAVAAKDPDHAASR